MTPAKFDMLMQRDEPPVAVTRNFADEDYIDIKHFTPTIPPEYCLGAEAVHKLEESMFGNLNRPEAIEAIKEKERGLSVGLASQRVAARKAIREAAAKGKLRVYGLKPNVGAIRPIGQELISKLILVRGGLPDHVGHLVQANNKSPRERILQQDLHHNVLLLKRDEFEVWRKAERSKGKWQSQGFDESKAPQIGRPKISREFWTPLIMRLVDQKKWRRSLGVPALHEKLIKESDDQCVPSNDTLTQILDEHCKKTKNPKLCLPIKLLTLKNGSKSPQK